MSERSNTLLTAYKTLDWDLYIDLCDKITKVDKHSIESNLEFQASLYSHYAGLEALARLDTDKCETILEGAVSEVINSLSEKLTAKKMDAVIAVNDRVKEAKEELHRAQYRYNLLHSLVKALEQKKDCLIQMSSNHRAEINLYAK